MKQHIVGAYEVGALLGSGTVGEVYRARHRDTGEPAVVKLLQAETAREPEIQRRFVREVAIAEKLDHPNIVRHFDCGLHEDQIYFAMELVECGTLKDVLQQRGTLPWREVAECAIQVCAALDHAHRLGIIHRDLKPANLFLSADGRVKVGDFGLARDLNKSRLTLAGQTVGTCRYMPPEQIYGEDDLTGAVDLYALGCMMYQMLVGRPPFDGDTIVEIFEAHLNHKPTPPAELVRGCPRDLSDLVLKLLAKNPADRPASATEVRTALVNILHGRSMKLSPGKPNQLAANPTTSQDPAQPNLTARLFAGGTTAQLNGKYGVIFALAIVVAIIVIAIIASLLR